MDLTSTILSAQLPDVNTIRFRPFAEGDAEMIKDVILHRHYDFLDLKAEMWSLMLVHISAPSP